MTKIENKFIDFINKYMVHIGIILVTVFALGIRYMGRKYTGHDAGYLLYDMPGNYSSFLYREMVTFLTGKTEHVVFLLKMLAYVGDAGIFALTCIILGKKWVMQDLLRVFYVLTAIMLSPVLLQSSVAGMRLDSVAICLLLLAYLAYRRKWYPVTSVCVIGAAIVAPFYWLAAVVALIGYVCSLFAKKEKRNLVYHISAVMLMLMFIAFSVVEMKTFCTIEKENFFINIFSPLQAVGTCVATMVLIISFKKPKFRKTALTLQVVMLMIIGYWQTYHTAIWTIIENCLNAL